MAAQIDPSTLATRLPALFGALKDGVMTSINVDDLSAWTALAQRVQHAPELLLGLESTSQQRPDYGRIHERVQAAIQSGSVPTGSTTPASPGGSGTTAPC